MLKASGLWAFRINYSTTSYPNGDLDDWLDFGTTCINRRLKSIPSVASLESDPFLSVKERFWS